MTVSAWSTTMLVLLLCALLGTTTSGQTKPVTGFLNRTVEFEGSTYTYQVYIPSDYDTRERWPVILFLHGSGERGTDGLIQTQVGLPSAIRRDRSRYPAIVVMPQVPPDSLWTGAPARAAMEALKQTMKEFHTDADRVYLTGLSMGGNGTWYLAYRYASTFAAIAPICGWVAWDRPWGGTSETVIPSGTQDPFAELAMKLRNLPIWIFHGEEDPAVPVEQSRRAYKALLAVGADAKFTEMPGIGHNSWDAAYASTSFSAWLFSQKRSQ